MSRLRDIELRWQDDGPAPEWFWKRGHVAYLFYKEVRARKIETPGVQKINVYCTNTPAQYGGVVVDGVTDVQVAANWSHVDTLSPAQLCDIFISRLADGAKTVLEWFGAEANQIDVIAQSLREKGLAYFIPIGTQAVRMADGLGARLRVRPGPNLTNCVVVAVISRGRTPMGEISICTTYPSPEYAIENFKSLEWDAENRLVATFWIYGTQEKLVFGSRQFDSGGLEGVTRSHLPAQRQVSFTIDVSLASGV